MADHHFFKHTLSLADIEFINCFSAQDPSVLNFHNSIPPQNLENLNFHGFSVNAETAVVSTPLPPPIISPSNDRKRKAMDITINTPESSSANTSACSSPQVSESGKRKTKRRGRGKKEEGEKPKEVIHVRAKRGQATDSHSLAERVRRGKINERLRCLQDIVPGCYKTMGMAVMLDEIINYVQSLQSQVDFLSMKLGAVSSFYNFNTDVDAMEAMQRENAFGALKVESVANEFSQLGQNLGYCKELAHTRL